MTQEGEFRGRRPASDGIVEARLDDDLAVPIRRRGNPDGPRLLISHGNGLAIDLYRPYWSLLLDDFDLILFDLRNHGRSPVGDPARHTVPTFCRDLEAVGRTVDRAFGMRPRAGVFHSVSCLAAALSPSLGVAYSALVLFDPPFTPGGAGDRAFESAYLQAAARTRIRARRFPSERDFIELMEAQPAMARLRPGVIELMARTTLRPAPGGGREIRCPPGHEAAILSSIPGFSRMVDPDSLPLPVKVIGADPNLRHYFLPPCDLRGARSVEYEYLPGSTHLAQLEEPRECARLTRDFLERTGFGPRRAHRSRPAS